MKIARKFVLWGGTGHSVVLQELMSDAGDEIIAIFDNNTDLESPFENVPIYYGKEAFELWWDENKDDDTYFVIAIAGWNNAPRLEYHEYLKAFGLKPATLVHPSAFVAKNATLGEACNIMTHATICARTTLEKSVIVNSGSIVDHESTLRQGVHVSAGCNIGALVDIGENTFVGIGATIMSYLKVGQNVFVGAGAVVLRDIPDNAVVYGVPAKIHYYRDEAGNRLEIDEVEGK